MFTYSESGAVIAVTNRKLCEGDFLGRIMSICEKVHPDALILREKDLTEEEYGLLAAEVMGICEEKRVTCILHSFYSVARKLGCRYVHTPFGGLREECRSNFQFGVSIHSAAEAKEAVTAGASYLIAGHIYATDCKKNLVPRGIDFLREICECVDVPVFGIGGMDLSKMEEIKSTGAAGICIMSAFMKGLQ